MNDVERFPMDFEKLEKGDVIPAVRLEEIAGVSRNHQQFPLKVLALKELIEQELLERGKLWTLAYVKGDLHILTDAEAATYNYRGSQQSRRRERRCFVRKQAVDVMNLSETQKKDHERQLEIQGRFIQAQSSVRSALRLEATKRNVPGLIL